MAPQFLCDLRFTPPGGWAKEIGLGWEDMLTLTMNDGNCVCVHGLQNVEVVA